ncbi:hypothetical protein [Flavobacterium sp. N3904]|uniref:hypothetical protein n=1 Tax=Flavobacterium sp. N3904 TaxID=2986835 RepID=UPI0022248534|nr:hypothetical protein [Flavobacterium sp. N3904]
MKKYSFLLLSKSVLIVIILFFSENVIAQYQQTPQSRSPFWQNVQFGGGLGLSFGSGYTDISIAPSAIYNVNPYLATGIGLQATYVSSKGYYDSGIYGISYLVFVNPIPQIQLSVNLNESYVNNHYEYYNGRASYSDQFWNTALFLGAGYRTGNVTIGLAYNVLYDVNDNVYGDAVTPFVRAYF